jgi:hypothetical protein
MYRRHRAPLAAGAASLIALLLPEAHAQTISPTSNIYPARLVNGQATTLRASNLNPQGVSFSDCEDDMTLQFSVVLSGFTGQQNMQIWASRTGDCTQQADRGIGVSAATCWQLSTGLTGPVISSPSTSQWNLRVQDIIGPQNNPPFPPSVVNAETSAACTTQATFLAETITIFFVPLDTSGNLSGTAYQYPLPVDLVGPPAPVGVSENVGNTLMNVTWTANSDSDTIGYDLFIDPIPGMEDAGASMAGGTHQELVCPDSGTSESDAADDAEPDGAPGDGGDGGTSAPMDAGCHMVTVANTTGGSAGSCGDQLLEESTVQDSGAVIEDSDGATDAGTIVSGPGGISDVPDANLLGAQNGGGATIADKSAGQYTITGLTNGVKYHVVVAAVDAFGNVGPSSNEVCDLPAPTQDFWQTYKNDGGGAGGGFCALEAPGARVPSSLAGAGLVVTAVALFRRRRRRAR